MKVDLKHILTPNILKKTLKVFYFEAFCITNFSKLTTFWCFFPLVTSPKTSPSSSNLVKVDVSLMATNTPFISNFKKKSNRC